MLNAVFHDIIMLNVIKLDIIRFGVVMLIAIVLNRLCRIFMHCAEFLNIYFESCYAGGFYMLIVVMQNISCML